MSDAMSEKTTVTPAEYAAAMQAKADSLYRITEYGILNGKRNVIADFDVLAFLFSELAAVRAELVKAKDDAEATWLNTTANMVRRDQYEFVIEKCNTLTAERDEAVSRAEKAEAELREAAWIIQRSGSADLEVKHYAAAFLSRHRGGTT